MAGAKGRTTKNFYEKDQGYDRLMLQFRSAKKGGTKVFVGFLRSSGEYKPRSGGERQGQPVTVAQIAAIHEFGAPGAGIPERSFMRGAIDQNGPALEKFMRRLTLEILLGKSTRKRAFGILGEFVKNLMKRTIQRGVPPPNAPETIRRKGSSKPLIDTGQMINSIDWEVEEGGGRK